MKICSVDDCSRVVSACGYCSTHYRRYKAYGDPKFGGDIAIKGISKNLIGKRFGMLICESYVPGDFHIHAKWRCKCDCGNLVDIRTSELAKKRSCGCHERRRGSKKSRYSVHNYFLDGDY